MHTRLADVTGRARAAMEEVLAELLVHEKIEV